MWDCDVQVTTFVLSEYCDSVLPCHLPVVVHDSERIVVGGCRVRDGSAVVLFVRRLHPESDGHRTHISVHAF